MFSFAQKILSNYFVGVFLLAILIASTYYLWQPGMFYVHDFTIGAKIVEMANGLISWQIPVRWSANLGYGFGMPLYNFYAPLPYFIGALFYLVTQHLVLSIKFLYLFLTLITMIGSYQLGKKIAGVWAGLLLAAAFTLAPYRALNIFVRGALSEAFAMSFFPWVILGIEQLSDQKSVQKSLHAQIMLFISALAIVLSHNLSALIFMPFALIWALIRLKKKQLFTALLVLALTFLSSSFYSLPAFFEQDLTQVNKIFTGYFDFRLHFLSVWQLFQDRWAYGGSTWGPNDDISFFLGWGQLIAGLVLLFVFLIRFKTTPKKSDRRLVILAGSFASLTAFLTLQRSSWLWERISLLSYVQFSWRFLALAAFFLAVTLAAASQYIRKLIKPSLLSLFLLVMLFNAQFFRAERVLDSADRYYYSDSQRLRAEMSQTLPDYIPAQMGGEELLAHYNQVYPEPLAWTDEGVDLISHQELVKLSSHRQVWQLEMAEAANVNFKIANFSGWRSKIDQEPVEPISAPGLGNIQLPIPAGQHQVDIYFGESRLRLISDLISLFAMTISVTYFIILKRKQTNQ